MKKVAKTTQSDVAASAKKLSVEQKSRPVTPSAAPIATLAAGLQKLAIDKGVFTPSATSNPAAGVNDCFEPATEAQRFNIWRLNQGGACYYIPGPEGESWIALSASELKLELKVRGVACSRPEDSAVSDGQRLVQYIQTYRNVAASAEALAGYRAGIHEINGRRLLVRTDFKLIEPCKGEFPTLQGLIESLLKPVTGRDLTPYFYAWLKVAYESLREGTFRIGQILYLIGPPGCGKSRLQNQIITPLLGGRSADPLQFMTGRTNFNDDLGGAEHLQMEDPDISPQFDERDTFGKRLKQFAANEGHRLHPKGT